MIYSVHSWRQQQTELALQFSQRAKASTMCE